MFCACVDDEHGQEGKAEGKVTEADEYFDASDPSVSSDMVKKMKENEKYGWWANVDFTDDPSKGKWARFIFDSRYGDELDMVTVYCAMNR